MTEIIDYSKKILLLGDPSVGKTCLVRKFVYDIFNDGYISTLGTKVTKKAIVYDNLIPDTKIQLTLLIWDVMGQKDFARFHQVAYTGCQGAFIVCDISRIETINNWVVWKDSLFKSEGELPIILLGNKIDLAAENTKGVELFKSITAQAKVRSFLTSALTGENVEKAFQIMGEDLLKNQN